MWMPHYNEKKNCNPGRSHKVCLFFTRTFHHDYSKHFNFWKIAQSKTIHPHHRIRKIQERMLSTSRSSALVWIRACRVVFFYSWWKPFWGWTLLTCFLTSKNQYSLILSVLSLFSTTLSHNPSHKVRHESVSRLSRETRNIRKHRSLATLMLVRLSMYWILAVCGKFSRLCAVLCRNLPSVLTNLSLQE